MRWEANEDKVCCLIYIKNHVLNKSKLSTSIQEAEFFGVDKTEGSIMMKFNNIASLCDDYGIKTSATINRLAHYSRQNQAMFESVKDFSLTEILAELNKCRIGLLDK